MKKVCFFCDWGENSSQLFDKYRTQTPSNSGVWGDIQGVRNKEEADYYVVMDGGFPQGVDRSKIIYLQREPPNIKNVKHNYPDILFQGTYDRFYQASVWWIKRNYDYLDKLEYSPKPKRVSCVMSGKVMCVGHKKRLQFAKQLSEHIDIDFWGRYLGGHIKRGYRGQLDDKYDGVANYDYSLVFENTNTDNYFTEKICDAFLTHTMPLYHGCVNIHEYFPKESYYDIRGKTITEIKDIINRAPSKENIEALKEAKDLVLNKYNLWATLERLLK